MSKLGKALKNPYRAIEYMLYKHRWMTRGLSDKQYIKLMYRVCIGEKLDLNHPKTYTAKLQWLKLYDRRPQYSAMVDKYDAKEYIAARIGEEYVVKNYGVWERFEDIDFDKLPSRFVLKCTHDCGGLVICHDKSKLDLAAAEKKINKCLKHNYYKSGREWPYKNVKPRIIAEEYLEDTATGELRDYKFFTFDGVPKALFIASDRQSKSEETKFDFFDMDYNHLEVLNGHPNSGKLPEKPINFEKMKELAAKLSEGIPHLRVDFYEVDGKVYVGELTFFHWSGFVPFNPREWDEKLGDWLTLPAEKHNG